MISSLSLVLIGLILGLIIGYMLGAFDSHSNREADFNSGFLEGIAHAKEEQRRATHAQN